MVTIILDVTPLSADGAFEISALFIGDWKSAAPTPKRANLHRTSCTVEKMLSWVRDNKAKADMIDPINARLLEPNLSDSIPLIGAKNIIIIGDVVRTSPVKLAWR